MKLLISCANTCLQHKLFQSIDTLPMDNWRRCLDNDLSALIEKKRAYHRGLAEHFETIFNQFWKRFGQESEYKKHLERLKRATELMGKIGEGDITVPTIKLKEVTEQIEAFTTEAKKRTAADFDTDHDALERFNKYPIDLKTITVARYYGKVKNMRIALERIAKAQASGKN